MTPWKWGFYKCFQGGLVNFLPIDGAGDLPNMKFQLDLTLFDVGVPSSIKAQF